MTKPGKLEHISSKSNKHYLEFETEIGKLPKVKLIPLDFPVVVETDLTRNRCRRFVLDSPELVGGVIHDW
jgi:hypothetical protein